MKRRIMVPFAIGFFACAAIFGGLGLTSKLTEAIAKSSAPKLSPVKAGG